MARGLTVGSVEELDQANDARQPDGLGSLVEECGLTATKRRSSTISPLPLMWKSPAGVRTCRSELLKAPPVAVAS